VANKEGEGCCLGSGYEEEEEEEVVEWRLTEREEAWWSLEGDGDREGGLEDGLTVEGEGEDEAEWRLSDRESAYVYVGSLEGEGEITLLDEEEERLVEVG